MSIDHTTRQQLDYPEQALSQIVVIPIEEDDEQPEEPTYEEYMDWLWDGMVLTD